MVKFFRRGNIKSKQNLPKHEDMLDQFEATIKSLEEHYLVGGRTIRYSDLALIPVYGSIKLGPGSLAWKLPSDDDDKLRFMTLIYWGGRIPSHKHDSMEYVKVLQGQIFEARRDEVFKPGEEIIITPGQYHEFSNISTYQNLGLLYVVFKKPKETDNSQ